MNNFDWLMVAAVFALAGGVKGVTGMGLPTVAMSLLGLWLPTVQAAALLIIPSLVTNVAQCQGAHLRALTQRLWPGWLAIVVATLCAPGLGDAGQTQWVKWGLGLILVAYGVWGLCKPQLPNLAHTGAWCVGLVGAVTGIVTAMTGIFVLPWVPYLQTLGLRKDEMIQALGLSFTVATLALAVRVQGSANLMLWSPPMLMGAAVALAAALVGLQLGAMLRGRLAGPVFQRALFGVFVALGTANLLTAR